MRAINPIYTVGHSTRPIHEFVKVLRDGLADFVIDVRTVPRSRRNPQYNEELLPDELAPYQVGYRRISHLGGLRGRSHDVPPNANGLWQNQSFHNYADYTLSAEFAEGLEELLALSAERRCAIMCAEAVWWRCHRRIIADFLLARGRAVLHLMGGGRIDPARLTSGAQVQGARVMYPSSAPEDRIASA